MKEFQRVQGNKLTRNSIILLGLILGLLVTLINIFMGLMISIDITPESGTLETVFVTLVPTYIYLILFSTMIDYKLFFPMIVVLILGQIFTTN
jgi:hypothetical protein